MQHKSLIGLADRLGLKINRERENKFSIISHLYCVEWFVQNERAVAVYIIRNGLKDNLLTDYFPGLFPKTLKTVKEFLEKI